MELDYQEIGRNVRRYNNCLLALWHGSSSGCWN